MTLSQINRFDFLTTKVHQHFFYLCRLSAFNPECYQAMKFQRKSMDLIIARLNTLSNKSLMNQISYINKNRIVFS
jgi:hypothetical protein